MSTQHLALIVEDDRATSEDLVEILTSLDCACVPVSNKQDALAALNSNSFCLVLLDLEIKSTPRSSKGHSTHGQALLREIRRSQAIHTGQCFWLPVVIVSGFAREVDFAVELMRDGASDVVQKPVEARVASDVIRRALERSGRSSHVSCGKPPTSQLPLKGATISLTIPGDRDRRRTRIALQGRPISVPTSSLKVLLHLVVAHLEGRPVHKVHLGASQDQGFKGISILRDLLKPALGGDIDVIENDYQGNYTLTKDLVVGACDTAKLLEIGDKQIAALARKLRELLDAPGSKV